LVKRMTIASYALRVHITTRIRKSQTQNVNPVLKVAILQRLFLRNMGNVYCVQQASTRMNPERSPVFCAVREGIPTFLVLLNLYILLIERLTKNAKHVLLVSMEMSLGVPNL